MNAHLDMTLRDWFAGMAMQALVARRQPAEPAEMVAAWAYQQADAMLAKREAHHADTSTT